MLLPGPAPLGDPDGHRRCGGRRTSVHMVVGDRAGAGPM
jgi:hypothetical protein